MLLPIFLYLLLRFRHMRKFILIDCKMLFSIFIYWADSTRFKFVRKIFKKILKMRNNISDSFLTSYSIKSTTCSIVCFFFSQRLFYYSLSISLVILNTSVKSSSTVRLLLLKTCREKFLNPGRHLHAQS